MTNRRRISKGKTSLSKKSESPDKQTKKLSRRGRRSRKSESPEQPENVGSECSGEETEDGHNKRLDRDEESDSCKESSQFDVSKSNDDLKSLAKEEESGGSDGSWKVKSENGGGGGIPKLKLCLTRPPEMPSPTSEQNSSLRKRRRSGRGNATPTKEEQIEENTAEESSKRVTRNQKIRESQVEIFAEKEAEELEDKEGIKENVKEGVSSTNIITYSAEEDETRLAVESICDTQQNDENQLTIVETLQEEIITKEDKLDSLEKIPQPSVEQNSVAPVEEIPIPSVEQKVVKTVEEKKVVEKIEEVEGTKEQSLDITLQTSEEGKQVIEVQVESAPPKPEMEPDQEPVLDLMERRRSSSRDSSEERAKEAALRSRNKNKKKEGSEEGEVIESPGGETLRQIDLEEKSKNSSVAPAIGEKDSKGNLEEPVQAKSGARKRRWGSSTSRINKKPSVSISTDFLKEIIPEAKPLLMSEVQLSPNEEDEEGQLKDSEESLPIATKKVEREKMIHSDESEKDYEEEAVESGMEESTQIEMTKTVVQIKEKEFTTFTRKVSVMSVNERLQKSPSPPRNKPSNILYIINLVRPFTVPQLRELLARTGTIVEDGFWIDKIKSRCYVKYETEEQAKTTRHALHGVRWPVSNPKHLSVDFGTEAAMKAAMEGNEIVTKRPIPSLFDKQIDLKTSEKIREREKERDRERERDKDKSGERREKSEKDKKERNKHREEEKKEEGEEEKDKKSRPLVEPLVRDRTVRRVTMPIREWDVGKNEDGFSPPPDGMEFSRRRDDRYERRLEYDKDKRDDYDDRRRRERDRGRRSMSGEPPRKSKKKTEEEAPAKLLDDLFRKTKAAPCIYWLPLTPEQIAVKEEMRRKHMAEHEKKVAELKKMQREQNKRSFDKRRRRTRSRSRSRSAKK